MLLLPPLSQRNLSNFYLFFFYFIGKSEAASFNGFATAATASSAEASQLAPPMTIFDASGIRVILNFERSSDPLDLSFASSVPPCVQIRASSQNTGSLPIESYELQVAVPRTFQLEMLPPSATCLLPAAALATIPPVTQVFKVTNPNRVRSRLASTLLVLWIFYCFFFCVLATSAPALPPHLHPERRSKVGAIPN